MTRKTKISAYFWMDFGPNILIDSQKFKNTWKFSSVFRRVLCPGSLTFFYNRIAILRQVTSLISIRGQFAIPPVHRLLSYHQNLVFIGQPPKWRSTFKGRMSFLPSRISLNLSVFELSDSWNEAVTFSSTLWSILLT